MGLAGLGSQTRPCLRLTFAILCITIMTVFYFLNDMSNVTYNEFVWNLSNDYTFPENLTGPYQQESIDTFNSSQKEGYLVYSPSCRLPDIDPYHESIRSLLKKVSLVNCAQLPPITSISGDKLVFNKTIAKRYSNKNKMTCCYQVITRPSMIGTTMTNPDDSFNMSPCKELNRTVTLKEDDEFIMVKCSVAKTFRGKKEVYGNMHARLIKKAVAEEKTKQIKLIDNQLSILLLGIDSISRLNLLRTMPKTVKFLKEKNFLELKGYNKIDDNTFPNLIAILTGMTVKQYGRTCWNREKEMDGCPLIWFNASKLGYVTSYVEDEPTMGTFNYHKKGFKNSPTDYYFRPFMLAAEKYMKIKRIDGLEVCIGPTLTADCMLNYAKEFINYFKNKLYFSLIWMNNFSHNNVNAPSSMDTKMYNFFTDTFKNDEIFNSTAVIFLSDHGMRFGKIRETYVGWLEERLPFIYIWLPKWYRDKFKTRYNNLITNGNRLTSPYDLHLTIKDLIVPPGNDEYYETKNYTTQACPNCVSLFEPVPWNRSCENAGVTEHWCTCSEYRTLSTEGVLIRAMVHYAVKEINNMLEIAKNLTTDKSVCAKLGVKRILTVRSTLYDKPLGHNDYIVLFETLPGAALFETTIRHDKTFKILDSISRINAYFSQSNCMPDAALRKYCFCTKKSAS